MFMKMDVVRRRFAGVEASPLDPALRTRMIRFSTQGIGLLLLNLVVWDRSDMVFLKYLNNDKVQIAFFSQAFTLTEKLLLLPQIVGWPVSMTLLSQAGKDRTRLCSMTTLAGLYLAVLSLPLFIGAAAVAPALWKLVYRPDWAPAVPVLVTMILLAIPRALVYPAQQMLRAEEKQDVLLKVGWTAAVMNLILDAVLVPGHGALGAAVGNGCAQAFSALGTWFLIWRMYQLRLPFSTLARLLSSSLLMGAVATAIVWALRPAIALPLAVTAGCVVFPLLLRWLRVLAPQDRERLLSATDGIPAAVRPVVRRLLHVAIPAVAAG
jgi:O-antigen/teichoic acid export membrane protein